MLSMIQQQPRAGTPTNRPDVFRLWLHPYPYIIDYRVVEDERDGSGNLNRYGEWSFCLTAARMAAEQERR